MVLKRKKRSQVDTNKVIPPNTPPPPNNETMRLDGKVHPSTGVFPVAQTATILAIIFIFYLAYRTYEAFMCYLVARRIETVIDVVSPHQPTVGQTLTCRIRFVKNDRTFVTRDSELFRSLQDRCTIWLANEEGVLKNIAALTEPSPTYNHLIGKFSVRKSGEYEVFVKYKFLKVANVRQHFTITVVPGLPCYKNIDFGTLNPNVLCVTKGFQRHFKIDVNDEYGNKCRLDNVELERFSFKIFHMGTPMTPVECEFCHHKDTSSLTETEDEDNTAPIHICLRLRLDEPGVFISALAYDDHEVPYYQGSPKLVICITLKEEGELREQFSRKIVADPLLYSCPCQISEAGDHEDTPGQQILAGITYSNLTFAPYRVGLLLYPNYTYPVNGKTKMIFSWSHHTYCENETFSILVEDGLRESIWVEVHAVLARSLLLCFAHAQGFKLSNVGKTFQEKKKLLTEKLTPYFPYITWCNPDKILHLPHGPLLPCSMVAAPKKPEDWLLPFIIKYGDNTKLPVREWLNSLCDIFFTENEGLFEKLPGSRLYHPAPSTTTRHPIEYYKFCGQILAKCVVETLLRKACTRLSNVKFTKSFLAYMLGFPVNYKCLEADEPNYFRELAPIMESDMTNSNYMFTTLSTDESDEAAINLIPNGSDIPVSNENKEYYFNLLTKYRLIHSVEQEISAIRTGFYSVLNKDYLCDFHKGDLQMLISGGCHFDINDLKANYRVIKELDTDYLHNTLIRRRAVIDARKLQKWFFTAVQNMSEKEQSYLIFFVTGSFSLPSCGFHHLDPLFTISLTGTYNQFPTGNPSSNEIILGDHVNFDQFERSLLYAIRPESERIGLPQTSTENRMALYNPHMNNALMGPLEDDNMELEEGGGSTTGSFIQDDGATGGWRDSLTLTLTQDPFVNWLREMINL